MSSKAIKKYGNVDVPAQSLHPPDKDGYLTKQGGSIKTWRRRYFILKDKTLYYYKTPKDNVFTGKIELEASSVVKEERDKDKKKPHMFSIQTAKRIFYMFPDKPEETKDWVDGITKGIEKAKGGAGRGSAGPSPTQSAINGTSQRPVSPGPAATESNGTSPAMYQTPKQEPPKTITPTPSGKSDVSPRVRLSLAKQAVNFLKDEESKVLEFWQIWSESIPIKEELASGGMGIEFHVATSADMQKLTWRTAGPQNIFIQKMVDFFWNVGAPESEIDRLNDVGALINPVKIGSWIDMSAKGGMDGGWYFPVDVPLKLAVEAADNGEAVKKFADWAESNNIGNVIAAGRDMGAAPPRQTEIRVKLPGPDAETQIRIGTEAFAAFSFPPIPENALKILKESRPESGCQLSVITSSEGFVRLGLMVPRPQTATVLELCRIAGGNQDDMAAFEGSLGTEGPAFVEFQYLMKGFGYGVYKEGFDIVFHYLVGEETN